jgi:hypothetical protein
MEAAEKLKGLSDLDLERVLGWLTYELGRRQSDAVIAATTFSAPDYAMRCAVAGAAVHTVNSLAQDIINLITYREDERARVEQEKYSVKEEVYYGNE